jgi:hypothetical protein
MSLDLSSGLIRPSTAYLSTYDRYVHIHIHVCLHLYVYMLTTFVCIYIIYHVFVRVHIFRCKFLYEL